MNGHHSEEDTRLQDLSSQKPTPRCSADHLQLPLHPRQLQTEPTTELDTVDNYARHLRVLPTDAFADVAATDHTPAP